MTNKEIIKQFLKSVDQNHLIPLISEMTDAEISPLFDQINEWKKRPLSDFIYQSPPSLPSHLTSSLYKTLEGDANDIKRGKQALNDQSVHCIVLAGGEASRLNSNTPKALYPLFPGKTLLSLFIEKLSHSQTFTLLTSPAGSLPIKKTLPSSFPPPLIQSTLPFLDLNRHWILSSKGTIIDGPDGNGGLLTTLKKTGYLNALKQQGISTIVIMPIDNPLIDPYDPNLIGIHINRKNDLTLRCYEKSTNERGVGIIGMDDRGRVHIVDYTDLNPENPDYSNLKYANMNHMCLSIDRLIEMVEENLLPFHWVKKTICREKHPEVIPIGLNPDTSGHFSIYKGERFITDICPYADRVSLMISPKESSFAPLKREDDLPHIREQLNKRIKKS
ncbi:MAG: UTP--glucose-1-phosphate uridylyltransferase [Simkaniaceae bacterium]|nr:UTP--glucose-1-phosphate uridylyltransferase [Simkaniaceae bacterium]